MIYDIRLVVSRLFFVILNSPGLQRKFPSTWVGNKGVILPFHAPLAGIREGTVGWLNSRVAHPGRYPRSRAWSSLRGACRSSRHHCLERIGRKFPTALEFLRREEKQGVCHNALHLSNTVVCFIIYYYYESKD